MKFPVFSLLTGNFGLFRDEFAADSPLQQRVCCELKFRAKASATLVDGTSWRSASKVTQAGDRGLRQHDQHRGADGRSRKSP